MVKKVVITFVVLASLVVFFNASGVRAQDEDLGFEEAQELTIADPLEPWNRLMFRFNDRLYFWVLKPVAQGYSYILPQDVRVAIGNFFRNLLMPVRVVNCLLQGKLKGAGNELLRFAVNTTLGVYGFDDVAKREFKLNPYNEDLGQSLGHYGIGNGFYIVWPVLGPSTLRDTVGLVGDFFLDPLSYLESGTSLLMRAEKTINSTSLHLGDYEDLVEGALDPYVSLQDAYLQHRDKEVKR